MNDAPRPAPHPRPEPIPARPDPARSRPAPVPAAPPPAVSSPPVPSPPVPPPPVAPPRPQPAAPLPMPREVLIAAEVTQLIKPIEPAESAEPAEPAEPADVPDLLDGTSLSRAQRRRAQRDADRQVLLRRGLQAATVVLVAIVIVSLVVLVLGNRSTPANHPSARQTPTVTGANLADPGLVSSFLGSAATDVAAVTTYDYRNLDDALNAGLAVTTGKYRAAYRAALTGDLARTATAEHVTHMFEVLDIGIGAITADGTRAKVLIFGRERITDDRTGPATEVSPITLCVTIQRSGNRFRISDLAQGTDPGLPPGGPDLKAAVDAGRTEVTAMLSYRRANFDADLQASLDGAASPLREQLQQQAKATERAMNKGNYDSSGVVTATAVVRADTDTVTLLIAAAETREVDGAHQPTEIAQRYEVTVTRTGDRWAASRVASIDGGS